MKSRHAIIFVFLIFGVLSAAAQKPVEPRTVTDFYLLFPDVRDAEGNLLNSAERRKLIAVEDAANGYLKLKPNADQTADCADEAAIFKKSGGGYVFAYRRAEIRDGNCGGGTEFYERRADRWTDVAWRIFPLTWEIKRDLYERKKTAAHKNYGGEDYFFTRESLPRVGRSIVVSYLEEGAAKEFELFKATWNGERFVSDEPLPRGAKMPSAPSPETTRAAEAAWKVFYAQVLTAVKKRDRKTLRLLMSEDFSYNCCDEPYPDKRDGAFTTWDGSEKDFAGWKSLAQTLEGETMIETHFDDEPVRAFDDARFVFRKNRWYFIAYGADSM